MLWGSGCQGEVCAPLRPARAGRPGRQGGWGAGSPEAARQRLDAAWRSEGGWGALEAATRLPQRQDLSSGNFTQDRRAERPCRKRKRHPACFILDQGPPRMFIPGQVRRLSKLRLWGEKTPTTCRPPSPREPENRTRTSKSCGVCAGRPPFPRARRGLRKNPIVAAQKKTAFPEGAGPGLQQRPRCLPWGGWGGGERGSFPQTADFVVQTPKLFKKERKKKNTQQLGGAKPKQSPGFGSAWRRKCWRTRGWTGPEDRFWSQHLAIICLKASECFPQDQNIKFVLDKCA